LIKDVYKLINIYEFTLKDRVLSFRALVRQGEKSVISYMLKISLLSSKCHFITLRSKWQKTGF